MRRPAVFFDRDNTLIIASGYFGNADEVRLVRGAADAVARVRRLGFATVVASNQSGVARGFYTEDAVRAVNAKMDAMLLADDPAAVIDRHEYCPYHPDATVEAYKRDSDLRKPGAGMLRLAAEHLNLDLDRSWLIGDAPRDIAAGKAAGCRTILVIDPSFEASPAAAAIAEVEPDYSVASLDEAVDVIETAAAMGRAMATVTPTPSAKSDEAKLVSLLEQAVTELRRANEPPVSDTSVFRLLAGILQILTFAMLFVAYLSRINTPWVANALLLAICLQAMTATLLLVDRKR